MKRMTNLVPLAFLLYACSHLQTATSTNLLINRLERLSRSCCSEVVALKPDTTSEDAKRLAKDITAICQRQCEQSTAKDKVERKEEYMSSMSELNPNAYSYVQTKSNDMEREVGKIPIPVINPLEEHRMASKPYKFGRYQHAKSERSIGEKKAEITERQKRDIAFRPRNIIAIGFLMNVQHKISRI